MAQRGERGGGGTGGGDQRRVDRRSGGARRPALSLASSSASTVASPAIGAGPGPMRGEVGDEARQRQVDGDAGRPRRRAGLDREGQHLDDGGDRIAPDQFGPGLEHLALGAKLAALHPQHRAAVAEPQRARHVGEARRRDPPDLAGDVGAQREAVRATPDRRSAAAPAARWSPAARRGRPHIRPAAAGRGRSRGRRHGRAARAAASPPPRPAAAGGRAALRAEARRRWGSRLFLPLEGGGETREARPGWGWSVRWYRQRATRTTPTRRGSAASLASPLKGEGDSDLTQSSTP